MDNNTSEEIYIERLSYGASGIGKAADGKIVFVPLTVPGDKVLVEQEKDCGSFYEGRIKTIIDPSSDRVKPPCKNTIGCGGCSWGHISYEKQLEAKRANIVSFLVRQGHYDNAAADHLVKKCLPSKRETGYRNKLELGAQFEQGKFTLGFREEGGDKLSNVDMCPLAHEAIQKAPKALRGALRYVQSNNDLGIYRVGIRHSLRTQDMEVALWTLPSSFPRSVAAKTINSTLKTSSCVRIIADPGKQRKIKQVESLSGKGYWEEELAGCRFKTSAPSFFQTNTAQAETMIECVLDGLQLSNDSVVADLYAGGGTFSVPLAKQYNTVFAVESASTSVKDLRRNADSNNVDIEIIGGDSARELPSLGKLDGLVVDPPRAGLAKGVTESIASTNATRVAYVSCNPSTWVRDVSRFQQAGYTLTSVQPVDMFPQTYHTEIVSIFEK